MESESKRRLKIYIVIRSFHKQARLIIRLMLLSYQLSQLSKASIEVVLTSKYRSLQSGKHGCETRLNRPMKAPAERESTKSLMNRHKQYNVQFANTVDL